MKLKIIFTNEKARDALGKGPKMHKILGYVFLNLINGVPASGFSEIPQPRGRR